MRNVPKKGFTCDFRKNRIFSHFPHMKNDRPQDMILPVELFSFLLSDVWCINLTLEVLNVIYYRAIKFVGNSLQMRLVANIICTLQKFSRCRREPQLFSYFYWVEMPYFYRLFGNFPVSLRIFFYKEVFYHYCTVFHVILYGQKSFASFSGHCYAVTPNKRL